ncbi:hypothetical protein [Pelagibacterium xiamenense]|uniref:hypothetical protein n=1 Tax=Pelagibacterium xiamenense TaxID=2901140 RepID=UPI001E483156|nr:hypothetical protein [Pelagibacterium xiamenense]MCD7060763.1 hypothetical protein [Pelagibacterium xiamenense]
MNATPHILESALLLLAAFFIGCIIGLLLRRTFAKPAAQAVSQGGGGTAAAAVVPEPAPVVTPEPAPAPESPISVDLKQIKGIGPTMEKRLKAEGIHDFSQIAGWDEKTVARMNEKLNAHGRIEREDWVRQARALARGQ